MKAILCAAAAVALLFTLSACRDNIEDETLMPTHTTAATQHTTHPTTTPTTTPTVPTHDTTTPTVPTHDTTTSTTGPEATHGTDTTDHTNDFQDGHAGTQSRS